MNVNMLVTQSCPTLCGPMDCSPPGSSVHRILQARIVEWVAIPSSRGSSWPRNQTWVSCTAGRFFTSKPPWDGKKLQGRDLRQWGLDADPGAEKVHRCQVGCLCMCRHRRVHKCQCVCACARAHTHTHTCSRRLIGSYCLESLKNGSRYGSSHFPSHPSFGFTLSHSPALTEGVSWVLVSRADMWLTLKTGPPLYQQQLQTCISKARTFLGHSSCVSAWSN